MEEIRNVIISLRQKNPDSVFLKEIIKILKIKIEEPVAIEVKEQPKSLFEEPEEPLSSPLPESEPTLTLAIKTEEPVAIEVKEQPKSLFEEPEEPLSSPPPLPELALTLTEPNNDDYADYMMSKDEIDKIDEVNNLLGNFSVSNGNDKDDFDEKLAEVNNSNSRRGRFDFGFVQKQLPFKRREAFQEKNWRYNKTMKNTDQMPLPLTMVNNSDRPTRRFINSSKSSKEAATTLDSNGFIFIAIRQPRSPGDGPGFGFNQRIK